MVVFVLLHIAAQDGGHAEQDSQEGDNDQFVVRGGVYFLVLVLLLDFILVVLASVK